VLIGRAVDHPPHNPSSMSLTSEAVLAPAGTHTTATDELQDWHFMAFQTREPLWPQH